jgi:hypothetical protein
MKLEKILSELNTLEKNAFIKIIDNILSNSPKNIKEIDKIISECENSDLKSLDNVVISRIFNLIESEFSELIKSEFLNSSSQLDIISDILIRDGNCIMKQEWFSNLYEDELKSIKKKVSDLKKDLDSNPETISSKTRDYNIYKSCLSTAYFNDIENNREAKVSDDEQSILNTLADSLELSLEEIKLINYIVIPIEKLDIDDVVNDLRNIGLVFFSRKNREVFVADEVIRVLREIRGKKIADKHYRRLLKCLREPQINLVCKNHNIDWKESLEIKIKNIIQEGVNFSTCLANDIHKPGTSLTDRKKTLNEIWEKGLSIEEKLKGSTIEDKIENFISYFISIENDDKVSISVSGYDRLLNDLTESFNKLEFTIRQEFQLQNSDKFDSEYLLNYNIKPVDIIDLIQEVELKKFCEEKGIKSRGNTVQNILESYKDADNLLLENYVSIAFRDLNTLKENGLKVKEADLGIVFEDLTASIFEELGFNVDMELKKKLNTKSDKIDLLLNIGNKELILIECKTSKEKGYNKFSAVSRQMKSYVKLAQQNDYKIIKSLLIAPEFSDEFISDTELEFDLNLSLIKADSLYKILEGFKSAEKHQQFPYKLLLKDVLIDEARIIKAMNK